MMGIKPLHKAKLGFLRDSLELDIKDNSGIRIAKIRGNNKKSIMTQMKEVFKKFE